MHFFNLVYARLITSVVIEKAEQASVMANFQKGKKMIVLSLVIFLYWCVFAEELKSSTGGIINKEQNQTLLQKYFQDTRGPFTQSLTGIAILLTKIYNISTDNIGNKSNSDDAEYCPLPTLLFSNSTKLELDEMKYEKPSFNSSNLAQSISYYESRYKDSSKVVHPSVSDSHRLISEAVDLADRHLLTYDQAMVNLLSVISEMEAKSLRLGQQLNNSAVMNANRMKLIKQLRKGERIALENVQNWSRSIRDTEKALDRKRKTENQQTLGMLGLLSAFGLVPTLLGTQKDIKNKEKQLREYSIQRKASEIDHLKIKSDLEEQERKYDDTEKKFKRDLADQEKTNKIIDEKRMVQAELINSGIEMKIATTFLKTLRGKLQVLETVTRGFVVMEVIKENNLIDIADYFDREKELVNKLAEGTEAANLIRQLTCTISIEAIKEALASELASCPVNTNFSQENGESKRRVSRQVLSWTEDDDISNAEFHGPIDSVLIEAVDRRLINISDVYRLFRNGMTGPIDFQWDQLLAAQSQGMAVLDDLMVLASSDSDIVLLRASTFVLMRSQQDSGTKKRSSADQEPESFRNILAHISNSQFNILLQYQVWMAQLQATCLNLPDSLKAAINLLHLVVPTKPKPSYCDAIYLEDDEERELNCNYVIPPNIKHLISLVFKNVLSIRSDDFVNQAKEIEKSIQSLIDYTKQLNGATLTKRHQRDRCGPAEIDSSNFRISEDFLESSAGMEKALKGWENLITFLRLVTRTVKEVVIPQLETFHHLFNSSLDWMTKRHHQQGRPGDQLSALPLMNRLISQSTQIGRAGYLLHEMTLMYLKISNRFLVPHVTKLDRALTYSGPLSKKKRDEERLKLRNSNLEEAESIVQFVSKTKYELIVRMEEHEEERHIDYGYHHCSFNHDVDHNYIKECLIQCKIECRCDRYFLSSFLCA